MKGIYGYFTTILLMIAGVLLTLFLADRGGADSESLIPILIFTILLAGFAGGFVAPYHVMSNSLKSMGTLLIVGGGLIGIIYYGFTSTDTSDDPFAGLALVILLIVIIIGLAVIFVLGIIAVAIGGFIGSIFGQMVFKREQFDDFVYDQPAKGFVD